MEFHKSVRKIFQLITNTWKYLFHVIIFNYHHNVVISSGMKSIWMIPVLASILILGALGYTQDVMAPPLIGPLQYENFDLSLAGTVFDSPFNGLPLNGYFFLEDFEDSMFNVPGVVVTGSGVCITPTIGTCNFVQISTDSVDGDDGVINGWGNGITGTGDITNTTPHSHFATPGSVGLTYTFDDTVLCALPTHVGIVWTDGLGIVTFEAFDSGGSSLGTNSHIAANDGFRGQTGEDRFYGAVDLNGISKITISHEAGGIEVDHLQYGIERCTQEIEVDIDIKPGSNPSSVSCKNTKGTVPVAIFGTADFDVSTIDLSSLELNGVEVTEKHTTIHIENLNDDGFDDAVLHLDKAGVCAATSDDGDYPLKESADATLTGSNDDGDFEGTGDIRIVKR